MAACDKIGVESSRSTGTIWAIVKRMTPTVDVAQDYFRANAFRMAHKIVKEGSPQLLVDVLSRPNVGALDPIKQESGGGGGFFLSVQADSCGAVTVAVQQPTGALAPPRQTNDSESPIQEGEENGFESPSDTPEEAPRFVARSLATAAAIAYAGDKTQPKPAALEPRKRRRKGTGQRETKRRVQRTDESAE